MLQVIVTQWSLHGGACLASGVPVSSYRLLRRAFNSSSMALDRKQHPEPLGISEELTERVSDKKLLKFHGLIGGDWKPASDGATYQARTCRLGSGCALVAAAPGTSVAVCGAKPPREAGTPAARTSNICTPGGCISDLLPACLAASTHMPCGPLPVVYDCRHLARRAPRAPQVLNPATGKPVATLPRMKADETLAAIAAAHTVYPSWSGMTAKQRGARRRRRARARARVLVQA